MADSETSDQEDIIFWDLGSGWGKLVVQSYLELPRIQRSIGIEFAPTRHEKASQAWEGLVRSGLATELRQDSLKLQEGLDVSTCNASASL